MGLFGKKFKENVKGRGVLGFVGQLSGIQTKAGIERRQERRESQVQVKVESAKAEANMTNVQAAALAQATGVGATGGSVTASPTAAVVPADSAPSSTIPMPLLVGGFVAVMLLIIILISIMRRRSGAALPQ